MCSHGCVPDGILYNSLLDLLWDTGIPWVQSVAGTLLRRAVHEGHMHAPLAPVSSTPLEAEALLLLLLQMQPKRKAHPLAGKGDWQSAGWQQRRPAGDDPADMALSDETAQEEMLQDVKGQQLPATATTAATVMTRIEEQLPTAAMAAPGSQEAESQRESQEQQQQHEGENDGEEEIQDAGEEELPQQQQQQHKQVEEGRKGLRSVQQAQEALEQQQQQQQQIMEPSSAHAARRGSRSARTAVAAAEAAWDVVAARTSAVEELTVMPPDAASGNNNSAACIGGGMLSSGSGDAAAAADITRLPSAAAIQQQGAQEEMQGASRPSLPLLHHSAGAELRGVHEVRGSAAMMMHACMRAPYTWVHDCCNTTRWVSTERLSPHLLSLSPAG